MESDPVLEKKRHLREHQQCLGRDYPEPSPVLPAPSPWSVCSALTTNPGPAGAQPLAAAPGWSRENASFSTLEWELSIGCGVHPQELITHHLLPGWAPVLALALGVVWGLLGGRGHRGRCPHPC